MRNRLEKFGSMLFGGAVGFLAGASIGAKKVSDSAVAETKKHRSNSEKHLAMFMLMNQWVRLKQENISVGEYLVQKGYHKIAIYGMNYVGETLLFELKDSPVEVAYGIDRNAEDIHLDIPIVAPEEELEQVDAIIVTAFSYFNDISEMLSSKTDGDIISVEDIIYI